MPGEEAAKTAPPPVSPPSAAPFGSPPPPAASLSPPRKGKGFWGAFAPPEKVADLDAFLQPGDGKFIEVVVAWKNRILRSFHFHKQGPVFIGSGEGAEIPIPNLIGLKKYRLLDISSQVKVFLENGLKGALIQKKTPGGTENIIQPISHSLNLKPYEMARLDFKNILKVYVRFKERPRPVGTLGLLNLTFSETAAILFSILTTGALLFYAILYAPVFLQEKEDLLEKNIQAVVKFEKKPSPPKVAKVKLSDKSRAAKKKAAVVKKQIKKPKPKPQKTALQKSKKKRQAKPAIKKPGKKPGKMAASARGRKPPVKAKVKVGSSRPGGSLKTGKSGASAKTKAPDPTKTGLLGVFGGGGKLKRLDPGSSGSAKGGSLLGLAETSTGFAGTKESYAGSGVGTKTKELATGGQGASLVGIKGIKTKGRGGSLSARGSGRGGGLGSRGRVNITIGADDIEVEGQIDKAGILRAIRRNRAKFDRCYQFSLQQSASLQGSLKMEWQILPNGSVRPRSARAVNDQVGSQTLSDCMRRALSRVRFPPPPGGQIPQVSFRFVFSM